MGCAHTVASHRDNAPRLGGGGQVGSWQGLRLCAHHLEVLRGLQTFMLHVSCVCTSAAHASRSRRQEVEVIKIVRYLSCIFTDVG